MKVTIMTPTTTRLLTAVLLAAITLTTAHAADLPGVAPSGAPGSNPMFEKNDTNHDGTLSLTEMMQATQARTEKMFMEADSNHDGKLSRLELDAWRAQMREHMKARWQAQRDSKTPAGADASRWW